MVGLYRGRDDPKENHACYRYTASLHDGHDHDWENDDDEKNRFRPNETTPVETIPFRQGGGAGGKLKDQETESADCQRCPFQFH